ncbi:putative neutral ceramidase superfamily lipid hydrolase [Bacillus sp. F9_6S_D1_P_5]
MDTAKKGKLTLDEEGSDLIDCDMWITFENGTYKKYFIWVVDHHNNEVMIAQQDTPDDVNLTYYQLNEDSSKKVYNLLKKII